jgi:16S rRNA (guanine527-N7)-methyltransferase
MNAANTALADRLAALLLDANLPDLTPSQLHLFIQHLELIQRWNTRTNLTAIRGAEEILARHFVESIACAHSLPAGMRTLLDYGSGAGFPGIPIAICRPEIAVTLAESQGKKAAFLHEAIRTLALTATVHSARAETIQRQFDCITLRAVDRMEAAVPNAIRLLFPGGTLAVMTTTTAYESLIQAACPTVTWHPPTPLPNSNSGILSLGTVR